MARPVPMTSQGILDFASSLHAIGTRIDREAEASTVLGQSFLGPWRDYLGRVPWSDAADDTAGLVALVDEIRSPLHVINPTADYERLARFNARMQALWDDGKRRGQSWREPRPPDRDPGQSTSPGSQLETMANVAIVVGILWLLSRR